MHTKNSITNFVETQEILNNIRTSIKRLYANDENLDNDEYLSELTLRTLDVIKQMDDVFDGLLDDPGIERTAEQFDTSKEKIAQDVTEIMLYSTIARQSMVIDILSGEDE